MPATIARPRHLATAAPERWAGRDLTPPEHVEGRDEMAQRIDWGAEDPRCPDTWIEYVEWVGDGPVVLVADAWLRGMHLRVHDVVLATDGSRWWAVLPPGVRPGHVTAELGWQARLVTGMLAELGRAG